MRAFFLYIITSAQRKGGKSQQLRITSIREKKISVASYSKRFFTSKKDVSVEGNDDNREPFSEWKSTPVPQLHPSWRNVNKRKSNEVKVEEDDGDDATSKSRRCSANAFLTAIWCIYPQQFRSSIKNNSHSSKKQRHWSTLLWRYFLSKRRARTDVADLVILYDGNHWGEVKKMKLCSKWE